MAAEFGKHKTVIQGYFSGLYQRTGFNSRYEVMAEIYRDTVDNRRVKELEFQIASKDEYIRELEINRAKLLKQINGVKQILEVEK